MTSLSEVEPSTKRKVLEVMQQHGDIAFMQGYRASQNGIPLEDILSLARMSEGLNRILLMQDVVNLLGIKHEDMV